MSATKTKLDLSLDEIIKNNKKGQKTGQRNVRNGQKSAGLRRKGQGVLKRKSIGGQKKRPMSTRPIKGARNQANSSGPAINNAATQRLVKQLVKKALKQVATVRTPRPGAVRNVVRGRRGGIRNRGQPRGSLNRISQRSRVINRRSQNLNRIPITNFSNQARRGAIRQFGRGRGGNRRGNARVVMGRREPNPIQAQLNFLRRQQMGQRPVQAPVIIQQQPRRPVQRRQATRVIYVQQQRPPPVRRQPQQIIYVQQQPRRQFGRGRGGNRGRGAQRQNNNPFFEPPNFLQRIPASNQSFGRGRGRRFIEF